MRKISIGLAVALSLICVAALCGAGAAAKPAAAKLTIRSFPEGVFGFVSGAAKGCAENRKVVVFEKRGGQRDPGSDRKVGSGRARLEEGAYRWQVKTGAAGSYYAEAAPKRGCAAVMTGSVETTGVGQGSGGEYPTCSPYMSEGPSEICSLGGIRLHVSGCSFADPSGSCRGEGYGTSPWGLRPDGGPGFSIFNWATYGSQRAVVMINQKNFELENPPLMRMEAHMSDPGSHRLMVDRATVQSENGLVEFFTPNLPGQAAGEPGGPLDLNFEQPRSSSNIYLNGYLYVKR